MRWLRALVFRLGEPFLRGRRDRELAAEIASHFQMHVDDNIRAGMDPDAARRHAAVKFGGVEAMKETYRDRRGLPLFDTFVQDLRFGWRMLARNRGFTAVALTALAVGIGANIAIFSLANALLLRPLPIRDPAHVVRAYSYRFSNTEYSSYLEYRDQNRTLSQLAAFQLASLSLRTGTAPEHLFGMVVSGNYFDALGVLAARGRTITPNDDRPGAAGVAVLSDGCWRRRFAADADAIGRVVTINGHAFTIVGIAPPEFTGTMAPLTPELWIPWNAPGMAPAGGDSTGAGHDVHMIGRLKSETTLAQAQADLSLIASGIAQRFPATNRNLRVSVYSARTLIDEISGPAAGFVALLMGIVGLVLLIACVNIANLTLARSAARRREIGVRLALGAGRRRLIRQLLTESGLLATLGTIAAFAIAFVTVRTVAALDLPTSIPIRLDLSFDLPIVVFSAGIAVVTTLLFGLIPAWQSSKTEVTSSLKDGAPGSGTTRSRLRASLITAQVVMSTLLLVTGAVLGRSMASAGRIDRGFVSDRVLTASVDLETRAYSRERGAAFFEQLLDRLERTPGVLSVNLVEIVPLTLSNNETQFFKEAQSETDRAPGVRWNPVSRGHFSTLTIPMVAGRDFTPADRDGAPLVAIVNETLARTYWPGENPIGRRLRALATSTTFGPWIEVVGVVRDSKYTTIGESPQPFLYRPLAQAYRPAATLLVKTAGDPMSALPVVQAEVRALDPDLPLFNVSTLEAATAISLLPVRIAAVLAGSLGAVALLLAAIGLYGVMAYVVRQRTAEIGTRIALGARPVDVIRLMTGQGMRWTAIGLALGLITSLLLTRLLTGLLYGVQATDAIAFVGITILLAVTAFAACYLPARRASRLDPLIALRYE